MVRKLAFVVALASVIILTTRQSGAQQPTNRAWHFVASGDSRNCGDVVMPGIAETAKKNQEHIFLALGGSARDLPPLTKNNSAPA